MKGQLGALSTNYLHCGAPARIDLAFASLDAPNRAVYDGSWAEWGLPGDTPVITGS
jgi:3-mercaptopyruvate sulfurtransferase SseA